MNTIHLQQRQLMVNDAITTKKRPPKYNCRCENELYGFFGLFLEHVTQEWRDVEHKS